MKIAFFSELPFNGKTERHHANMRTEFAWFTALDATHISLSNISDVNDTFDLGIIIFPKKVDAFVTIDIVGQIAKYCKRTAFMQEGPSWYFQDLPLEKSLWFYSQMDSVDIVFAHNYSDQQYYEGLLQKPCYINPTLMIEDLITDLPKAVRKNTIIGGNLVRWYGGLNSYAVAQEFETDIWVPQMGRMDSAELSVDGLNHLPYMNWREWIFKLNEFKYAVHLNPNSIGGTFSLNCAFLGIPCIGNNTTDTQLKCFPELSVDPADLKRARYLAIKLKSDTEFYKEVSDTAKINYKKQFSETEYLNNWKKIIEQVQ